MFLFAYQVMNRALPCDFSIFLAWAVSHPSPQVAEILVLVGLDGILQSQITDIFPYFGTRFEETAA